MVEVTLTERLKASAKDFECPPSIQSMRNIRAINAMNEAAAELDALQGEVAELKLHRDLYGSVARIEQKASIDLEATIAQLRDRVAALEEGLQRLERANQALCAKRTQRTYLSMIDIDRCKDELLELDFAREEARALLTQNEVG